MGSPIVRLIDDILADIFTLVARECRAKRVDGWGPFKWIIVSHVCRHWRTIALDHAALWADQVQLLGNSERLQAFLQRARDLPLAVSAPAFSLYVYEKI